MPACIQLTHQWNGLPASEPNYTKVDIKQSSHTINVSFVTNLTSVFTAPNSPPEFTHGLWKYDVLEIFFERQDGSYLEIEVGPKAHWLVYEFSSYRKIKNKKPRLLTYTHKLSNLTWEGKFAIPNTWIHTPLTQCRVNIYQIRTTPRGKEYLAWRSIPAEKPDFHRTKCFDFLPI